MPHYLTSMGGFIKKMLLAKYLCDKSGVDVAPIYNHSNKK